MLEVRLFRQLAAQPFGKLIEPAQIARDVEVRILLGRDEQRGFGEIELLLGSACDFPQSRQGYRFHRRVCVSSLLFVKHSR